MSSYVKKKNSSEMSNKKLTLRQKLIVALGIVLCLVIIVFASAYGVFLHYYNKMNITSVNDNDEVVTAIDYEEDDINEQELTDEERQQLNQLLEDAMTIDEDSVSSENVDGKKTDPADDDNTGSETASDEDTASKDTAAQSVKVSSKDVTNILLVGTDSRQKENKRSRTDTMIILTYFS